MDGSCQFPIKTLLSYLAFDLGFFWVTGITGSVASIFSGELPSPQLISPDGKIIFGGGFVRRSIYGGEGAKNAIIGSNTFRIVPAVKSGQINLAAY
jgi:hypothetical protein